MRMFGRTHEDIWVDSCSTTSTAYYQYGILPVRHTTSTAYYQYSIPITTTLNLFSPKALYTIPHTLIQREPEAPHTSCKCLQYTHCWSVNFPTSCSILPHEGVPQSHKHNQACCNDEDGLPQRLISTNDLLLELKTHKCIASQLTPPPYY